MRFHLKTCSEKRNEQFAKTLKIKVFPDGKMEGKTETIARFATPQVSTEQSREKLPLKQIWVDGYYAQFETMNILKLCKLFNF